ncbi:hypothetical protein JKF63_00434 [Porcisia hertigi]|uniref:Mitochondrial import inner membrane translocase subunit TIM50 n=1 Tax=Porcisia hertigi TaxID=2761500 RepID=A0A836HF40_9TRYP|nr:hypothetical protein JKF63_00434 [Porcisia hertigi]
MRPYTSSFSCKLDEELKTDASLYSLGWRWSRQKTTPVCRAPFTQPRGRCLAPFNDTSPPTERDSYSALVDGSIVTRFRAAAAAYGVTNAPHSRDLKLPTPLILHSQYTPTARKALSDPPEVASHSGRYRHPTKGGGRENTKSSFLNTAPVGSIKGSARLKYTVQGASFSTTHLDAIAVRGPPVRPKRAKSAGTTACPSSPQLTPSCTLIPPPQPQDVGKLVVVLDLDETLVYSRSVTVYKRPGLLELLKVLKGKCELIVWTAGTREYALGVIRTIDSVQAVQYCIYRHSIWWSGDVGCTKDLRLLGRPMDRVILIDNTPSVFLANPHNSLLVKDFIVPYWKAPNTQENTLLVLAEIFEHIFSRFAAPCTADVLASKYISQQLIPLERGGSLELNVLTAV